MGSYRLELKETAKEHLRLIKKSGNFAMFKKITKLLEELEQHPTTGSGNPEQLKHELSGYWSRRINKKDRIIYQIIDEEVLVVVVSALGHYE